MYHRQREWELDNGVPCRIVFVARCHPGDGKLDFGGVGDFQGSVAWKLESGLMEKLGFKAVIVEDVDPIDDLIPDPMFTPEGGI